MNEALNEKLRLIRFRQRRESSTFRQELTILPKWLVWTCVALSVLALIIGVAINLHNFSTGGPIFPDDTFRGQPLLSTLALAGTIVLGAASFSFILLMFGYVYRDAKRRGMHAGLWTTLVMILSPAYLFIGLIIYLLVRDPLPYSCPQCSTTVNARYNFCPRCKFNLRPTCPQCRTEVSALDKYCRNCGSDLEPAKPTTAVVVHE
jgi:hypothetical protein